MTHPTSVALLPDRPEHLLHDALRGRSGIRTNRLLFIGDDEKQTVERLLRDVQIEVRVFLVQQAEVRGFAGEVVVGFRELHFRGRAFDDRQESLRQRLRSRLAKIFGCRGVATGQNSLRVLHDAVAGDHEGVGTQ